MRNLLFFILLVASLSASGQELEFVTKEGLIVEMPRYDSVALSSSFIDNLEGVTDSSYKATRKDGTAVVVRYIRDGGVNPTLVNKPFSGKKIVFFGDSVTEDGSYPAKVGVTTGATTYKVGFGGCRMGKHSNADYDQFSMYNVAKTIASQNFTAMDAARDALIGLGDNNSTAVALLKTIDFATVDIVCIFYGTNDWSAGTVIGTNNEDSTTLKGAMNLSVKYLMTAYPNLRVVFVTPTHRLWGVSDDADLVANSDGKYILDYAAAMLQGAIVNHLPVINLTYSGVFNKYNHSLYFQDGVHPNSAGDTLLGQIISAQLESFFKY